MCNVIIPGYRHIQMRASFIPLNTLADRVNNCNALTQIYKPVKDENNTPYYNIHFFTVCCSIDGFCTINKHY
jgi:hypothetical protein